MAMRFLKILWSGVPTKWESSHTARLEKTESNVLHLQKENITEAPVWAIRNLELQFQSFEATSMKINF